MRLSKPQKKLWPPTPDEAKTFTTGDVGHAGLTRHTPHNRATHTHYPTPFPLVSLYPKMLPFSQSHNHSLVSR